MRGRLASDVLKDLRENPLHAGKKSKKKISNCYFINQSKKELSLVRILSESELVKEENKIRLSILTGIILAFSAALLFTSAKAGLLIISIPAGASIGYIVAQSKLRARENRFQHQIVFYLPVVMERIVMAVQSGLDVVPALKAIEQIELSIQPEKNPQIDAVTLLLRRIVSLTEAGMSFEASVEDVTNLIDSHAFRHALIHLAVAHKEGGEIIYPLRELSDATQLYFQESVEEDIARMPIKATLPLLLTFAGLIITFMTGPLVQIMNVSANPTFVTENTKGTGR